MDELVYRPFKGLYGLAAWGRSGLEHFPIIQALCRSAMADPSPAIRKQIERLRDALAEKGNSTQAATLTRLLTEAARIREVAPSQLARSRQQSPDGILTPTTALPVDRETSAPLAELVFPKDIQPDAPLFNPAVTTAVTTIIEEWANFDHLSEVGLHPPRTCLIHGPPGTGKTRLALWIAFKLSLPVVLVRLDGLVSSFLGTTARNIRSLFTFANRNQCVLLLDEFDAIAKIRDDPQEVGEIKRVVNALLQNLDARQTFGLTIGITNHELLLDPAVWRRFEVQLEIPKPDFSMRVDIAHYFLFPVVASDNHVRLMAWITEGCTGAEIELIIRAYKKAVALSEGVPLNLIETMRQFSTLNSARVHNARRNLLFGKLIDLFRAMKSDPELHFSTNDIAEVSCRSPSTISRQLSKNLEQGHQKHG